MTLRERRAGGAAVGSSVAVRLDRRGLDAGARRRFGGRQLGRAREAHDEARTAVVAIGRANRSAQGLVDQVENDVEAEAAAAGAALGGEERLEDARQVLLRDADAVVRIGDLDLVGRWL